MSTWLELGDELDELKDVVGAKALLHLFIMNSETETLKTVVEACKRAHDIPKLKEEKQKTLNERLKWFTASSKIIDAFLDLCDWENVIWWDLDENSLLKYEWSVFIFNLSPEPFYLLTEIDRKARFVSGAQCYSLAFTHELPQHYQERLDEVI